MRAARSSRERRADPGPRRTRTNRREAAASAQWGVVGFVLLGLLLRAARIGESLWYDEINALRSFAIHGPGAIVGNYFDPVNHTFHTLLSWVSITALAHAPLEIAARVPALLFSLATIPVLYLLAKRAAGVRAGIIAAGLSAILPVLVLEGVDARGYSMVIFFAACSTLALMCALERESPWLWTLYALLAALGVWTHFAAAFVQVGHASWIVLQMIRRRKVGTHTRALAAIALAGVMSIALYAPALPDFLNLLGERDTFAATGADQFTLLSEEGYHALLQLGGSWNLVAALPGLALFLLGLVISMRTRESRCAAALLLLGLPLFAITVAISGTWVYARFMLFAMPGAVFLIAMGIDGLFRRHVALGVLAGVLMLAAAAFDLARRPPRQPLRESVEIAAQRVQRGEPVLALGLFHGVITIYQPPGMDLIFTRHADPDAFESALRRARPRCIIIYYPHLLTDQRAALLRAHDYVVEQRLDGWQDWGRGDVVVYRRGN